MVQALVPLAAKATAKVATEDVAEEMTGEAAKKTDCPDRSRKKVQLPHLNTGKAEGVTSHA